MRELVMIVLALEISVLVFVGGMAAAGLACGARPAEVSVGFGWRMARLRVGGVPIVLRLPPVGGSVKFYSVADLAEAEELPAGATRTWDELGAVQRVIIQLSGCAALLCVGGVVLGPTAAGALLRRSFGLVVMGAMSPLAVGAGLVQKWSALARGEFAQGLAVLSVVVSAYNLLPIPLLNGGRVIWEVLGRGRRIPWLVSAASVLCIVASLLAWAVAVVAGVQ